MLQMQVDSRHNRSTCDRKTGDSSGNNGSQYIAPQKAASQTIPPRAPSKGTVPLSSNQESHSSS